MHAMAVWMSIQGQNMRLGTPPLDKQRITANDPQAPHSVA